MTECLRKMCLGKINTRCFFICLLLKKSINRRKNFIQFLVAGFCWDCRLWLCGGCKLWFAHIPMAQDPGATAAIVAWETRDRPVLPGSSASGHTWPADNGETTARGTVMSLRQNHTFVFMSTAQRRTKNEATNLIKYPLWCIHYSWNSWILYRLCIILLATTVIIASVFWFV